MHCSHLLQLYHTTTMTAPNGLNGHAPAASGPTQVVLGSLERGDEYQAVVLDLKAAAGPGGTVQAEMLDRLLDHGQLPFLRVTL